MLVLNVKTKKKQCKEIFTTKGKGGSLTPQIVFSMLFSDFNYKYSYM
jgi:hypothetical protein